MKSKTVPPPRISDAEWVVMRILWQRGPLATGAIVTALQPSSTWKPKTIHTLLRRLVEKGALRIEKDGREYVFHPTVSAEDCEHAVARSFLSRFFDGDLAPFLARFVERENLSSKELTQLKAILERKK